MDDEQVPVLRLSPKAADAIRELAAIEGLSEGETVEVAFSVYAALPSEERQAAAKAALRDAPRPGPGEAAPDRASVARSFDVARARAAAEARIEPAEGAETDDDILAEAIRLTARQTNAASRPATERG